MLNRFRLVLILITVLLMVGTGSVQAHASLASSDPPSNASLDAPPPQIVLRFTEPLEADFSRFTLRDSGGNVVETPPSQVDSADPFAMTMQPGTLPDGLYTVVWRVLSTDGHSTEGSFAFGVRVAVTTAAALPTIDETIPPESALIRWFNLVSLSLAVGSVAFWLFVWRPAVPDGNLRVEKRMRRWMAFGWILLGVSAVLSLMLQASIGADVPIGNVITHPALSETVANSRFGQIWLARLVYWIGFGVVLWLARSERSLYWVALIIGGQLLLTTSLYSHASAAPVDTTAAIAGDWLHLIATAVWIGGLVQFAAIIGIVRRDFSSSTQTLSTLVDYFSNFARIAVAGLIVSGFYAAWLQVGSVDGLLNTTYGRVLLIKIILVLPLLAISGVNLIFTRRGLQQAGSRWAGHLRRLIGAELALAVGVMAAVGILTAIPPARTVLAVQNAEVPAPVIQPFFEMQTGETLMAHLEIVPGYVGENTFNLSLYDLDGNPLSDAARVRLRFDHVEQNLGQSELRPEINAEGTYSAVGTNLSIPGEWRIRMTVQRPGEFDTVMDYAPTISSAPPPAAPVIETIIPVSERLTASLLTAVVLLGFGGFFAAQTHPRWLTGTGILTIALFAVGIVFFVVSVSSSQQDNRLTETVTIRDAWMLQMSAGFNGGVYLSIDNDTTNSEQLIGVTTPVSERVEFHRSQIEANGVGRMIPTNVIDVAPDSTFTFSPGVFHMMLIDLLQGFVPGDTFPITLMFASGTTITTDVQVVDYPPSS